MVELSPATTARLHRLFRPEHVAEATRLLNERCADDLPLIPTPATPSSLERLRFAAIRVSGGDLARLREAIRIARVDWRDLLVAAGFGDDPRAHERWEPRVFDAAAAAQWKTGALRGVSFRAGDRVRLLWGVAHGGTGSVAALVGLEPEPSYRVRLDTGGETDAFQKMLAAIG